eukprot:sb/3478091/
MLLLPIVLPTTFALCYIQLGIYGTLAGFISIMAFVPIQKAIGRLVGHVRKKAVGSTDKRIKLIGDVIASMKAIKMYNWEELFQHKVTQVFYEFVTITLPKVCV